MQETETEQRKTLVADGWYNLPHPWYALQHGAQAANDEPLPRPSRVIFEYDPPTPAELPVGAPEVEIPADGYPTLDREVSYQVKYFSTHGYWPFGQQSGLPAFSTAEMQLVRTIATMVATQPQAPVSIVTRDRLEAKGLLY